MSKTNHFSARTALYCMLLCPLLLISAEVGLAAENTGTEYYKMLSYIEYSGKTQFTNQVETLLSVRKQFLSDDKAQYFISSSDFNLLGGNTDPGQQPSTSELSFIIDNQTGYLSGSGKDLALLERINNECVRSLKKVSKENIGKTWEQSFSMPFIKNLLPGKITFTLTAMRLEAKASGEMIAVRALSEPFIVKAAAPNGGVKDVKARMNAVYLFDNQLDSIYLSASVFEAETNMNGSKENLRHEVATYKTDAAGTSVDLTGLGNKFEQFVQKIGLTKKTLTTAQQSPLPQWAQYEGLSAAQISNTCAAIACEGISNPVATIYIPAARTVAMQSTGTLAPIGSAGAISNLLAAKVTGLTSMKIAVAPAIMGLSAGTAGIIGGGAGAAVAIGGGGGGGGGGGVRSPATP